MEKKEELESLKNYGVRIGAPTRNAFLKEFVFNRVAGKFTIFNLKSISERIRLASNLITQYERKEIFLFCARDQAYYGVYNFSKFLKINVALGTYPAGLMTNYNNKSYLEPKLVIVTNPGMSKNVLRDAFKINSTVIGIVNSDERIEYLDLIIPGNNKSGRSISSILYWIAYYVSRNKQEEKEIFDKINIEDFITKEIF
ncbi:MAG: 30S ribosomal protein S2 [Candidatus Rehaiarchaeum fermentans]|nr:30S ribosomal protein S2 [Candidatus Rehaiarchaeum fermentans]MCW1292554.1 30S ribosomal protein S2 [Candidatus Rehaiarchaeum fermentans]MCW1297400.1 30S ribosomal protein S2 [Candidatus Rehaiarchaeum fermentans]MCW1302457.1 30S ribosomal protein S2 [Candidatus Rehaiarchaeum fermentans]